MKYIAMTVAVVAAGVISGCRSTPDPAQQQMLAQLREINASLQAIAKNIPDNRNSALARIPMVSSIRPARGADVEALKRIQALPENPTDEDIRRYVTDIKNTSIGQNSFSSGDPQVAMLKMIGPGHLEVLTPFLDERFFSLNHAIADLVGDEDKEKVLELLPQCPALAKAVVAKNWTEEAKETIFQLAQYSNNIYQLQGALGVYVNTPEDRQRVIDLYVSRPEAYFLFGMLKSMPDVDLAALTTRAWETQRLRGEGWSRGTVAARAAAYGNKKALEQAIYTMDDQPHGMNREAMRLLVQCTRQAPNPEVMQKWYRENVDKLVFDKEKGRWEVE